MKLELDKTSRRIALAIGISLLLHGLALWGPAIQLPQFKSSLPPLVAKLERLPTAPDKPKTKPKKKHPAAPEVKQNAPVPTPKVESPPLDIPPVASEPVATNTPLPASTPEATSTLDAASAPVGTETLAQPTSRTVDRPALPKQAQLTFSLSMKEGGFRVGETVHTLEIEDGHYVLQSVTKTVGVVSLFKSYEITQYSSGSYTQYGLQPEQFFEERKDSLRAQRNTVEFDYAQQRAHFSEGADVVLPADVQDILSVMYQFPPLQGREVSAVFISNGRKIERYEFEISTDEEIETELGKLRAVRLRKIHAPNEEGLEIWLAREYRLFPVKIRFTNRQGEVSLVAIITDIRVSEEQGTRNNAAN